MRGFAGRVGQVSGGEDIPTGATDGAGVEPVPQVPWRGQFNILSERLHIWVTYVWQREIFSKKPSWTKKQPSRKASFGKFFGLKKGSLSERRPEAKN